MGRSTMTYLNTVLDLGATSAVVLYRLVDCVRRYFPLDFGPEFVFVACGHGALISFGRNDKYGTLMCWMTIRV